MNAPLSFLTFYMSLASITILFLYKSFVVALQNHNTDLYPVIEWFTPNLRIWKKQIHRIWVWMHDMSLRRITYWLVRNTKRALYKSMRGIHSFLLSVIKMLEKHEDELKEKMIARGGSVSPRGHEQRLIQTLMRKR